MNELCMAWARTDVPGLAVSRVACLSMNSLALSCLWPKCSFLSMHVLRYLDFKYCKGSRRQIVIKGIEPVSLIAWHNGLTGKQRLTPPWCVEKQ